MMTVEEVQAELTSMIEDAMGDNPELTDEASAAADLFASLTYISDASDDVLAEVARREFGFVPGGARQAVADAFNKMEVEW
jgi:hypothetical protein